MKHGVICLSLFASSPILAADYPKLADSYECQIEHSHYARLKVFASGSLHFYDKNGVEAEDYIDGFTSLRLDKALVALDEDGNILLSIDTHGYGIAWVPDWRQGISEDENLTGYFDISSCQSIVGKAATARQARKGQKPEI